MAVRVMVAIAIYRILSKMKYISDERGMVPVLVVVLVVVLVAAVGAAVYNASKSNNKNAQTVNSTASPSPDNSSASTASPVATPTPTPAPTDQELITNVLKAHWSGSLSGNKIILNRLEGNYALASIKVTNGVGGGETYLKKSGGTWTITYETQNEDPNEIAKLGLPSDFFTRTALNTVLYTY
jgi:hypothetical protein